MPSTRISVCEGHDVRGTGGGSPFVKLLLIAVPIIYVLLAELKTYKRTADNHINNEDDG